MLAGDLIQKMGENTPPIRGSTTPTNQEPPTGQPTDQLAHKQRQTDLFWAESRTPGIWTHLSATWRKHTPRGAKARSADPVLGPLDLGLHVDGPGGLPKAVVLESVENIFREPTFQGYKWRPTHLTQDTHSRSKSLTLSSLVFP